LPAPAKASDTIMSSPWSLQSTPMLPHLSVPQKPAAAAATAVPLQPVLPKSGLVVSEKGDLGELLCKPKILPLKSATLKRLEALQVQGNASSAADCSAAAAQTSPLCPALCVCAGGRSQPTDHSSRAAPRHSRLPQQLGSRPHCTVVHT
jgi:hypothetical protein